MKKVILGTEQVWSVYEVPDPVAENLEEYCLDFCENWLYSSPDAARYRTCGGLCYDQSDFIDYLNRYVFPEEPSRWIQEVPQGNFPKNLPKEYQKLPCFIF